MCPETVPPVQCSTPQPLYMTSSNTAVSDSEMSDLSRSELDRDGRSEEIEHLISL